MKRLMKLGAVLLITVALLIPMFTVQASAAQKWNGTSTLKAGKSYTISTAVTMDSKFTVPEGTKLTVSKKGSLTVSKGVTATVKGSLTVSKGGTLKVNGTLNTTEESTLKISGKLTYGASAKLSINGSYSVTSTGTVTGSGTAEVNLSSKSQYNSDIDRINTCLEKENYQKACQLLENAIYAYPDKAKSLRKAYSTAVIGWADSLADEKNYAKACSILNSAKNYLTDTADVENRYAFYQGYIPVPLKDLKNLYYENPNTCIWTIVKDSFGNTHRNVHAVNTTSGYLPGGDLDYILDGKYTNLTATIACAEGETGGEANYFEIFADDVLIYSSEAVYNTTKPYEINVDITGTQYLKIRIYGYYDRCVIFSEPTVYKE